ncbi:MAG TPA: class I SAM-dependent methyltransferase [Puia sp.]|jgi:SAM-dependent methyltransferase
MKVAPDWFREWFDSPYYHKLYFYRGEQEASAFIGNLLGHLRPAPGSLMLDVACGRGRHSRILSEKGFDTTGIDLAAGSIDWALRYENDHLHFYRHDMRLPFWINYFDYAFNFFTSFGYFRTQREHSNAIRSISQSLKNKGVFVLDYLNVVRTEEGLVPESTEEIDGILFHMTRSCDDKHFYKKIVIEDKKLDAQLIFIEKIAKFTLADYSVMFSAHGLRIEETLGDYALTPFDPKNSPRLILIARKTG